MERLAKIFYDYIEASEARFGLTIRLVENHDKRTGRISVSLINEGDEIERLFKVNEEKITKIKEELGRLIG